MAPIVNFYLYLSQASSLIPVIAGIRYYKILPRPFKILFYFCVAGVFSEIVGKVGTVIFRNNMPGQHVYTVIEFLSFSAIFYLNVERRNLRMLIGVNAFLFFAVALLDALRIHGLSNPNDLSRGYASGFIILYTLGYLYYLFTIDDTRYMWEYPMFWLCTGALAFHAGTVLYGMSKIYLLINAPKIEWASHVWNATLIIISKCLYAQSIRCVKKQKMKF